MIEIYIDNELVDVGKTNISLQKEFSDEVENIPTDVEYSYTITLPATERNKKIFGFVETFDVANKFKRLYNAELYVDEQLIMSGKFKMTSIESDSYKGNIYIPKKKTVSDILGDRNLTDIVPHYKMMNGLADYDKLNNWVCQLTTDPSRNPDTEGKDASKWNTEGVKDNHIIFPYVLYGLPLNNPETIPSDTSIYTQDLQLDKHAITEDSVFPAFNVLSVIKDIFKSEGYNVTGNIFENGVMGKYFSSLYQTMQYNYDDYVNKKEVPFYLDLDGKYTNFYNNGVYTEISPTLQIADLWDEQEYTIGDKYTQEVGGNFKYGVDNPFSCSVVHNNLFVRSDEKKMFVKSSSDENKGIIIIPKSGWYKINLYGEMDYPYKGTSWWSEDNKVTVGGCTDEADNTDLTEQPFEFQLKKGLPAESPKLYSFNSFIPCIPNDYSENKSALFNCDDTLIRWGENNGQRRYAKNGKTALIKDYSNFPTTDFVCGVRLGGAWFSATWGKAHKGCVQRANRWFTKGAGLALPDVTKPIKTVQFSDEALCKKWDEDKDVNVDGKYFKISEGTNFYDYGDKTAQVLVRNDSYSNFEGYNQMNENGWDTTSDYGKVTYAGADNSTAQTVTKYHGQWDVNTCVWLEKGETLYLEALMPYHTRAEYEGGGGIFGGSSKWSNRIEWINVTNVNYHLKIGFQNSNKDWKPKQGDGIKDWYTTSEHKLTNVNQFLPNMKCNDYLEKFLKTFNLQLTMIDPKTFSIDLIGNGKTSINVIDIDKICDYTQAEFKPLKTESVKEYKWKIDTSETGYAQGNQSPYKGDGWNAEDDPWFESGYTGEGIITNEANTSGTIKKIEAPWSYSWYKTIHFLHPYYSALNPEYFDVNVIADKDLWKDGMTFNFAADEKPQTTKTMRLFMLAKDTFQGSGANYNYNYKYISFCYDSLDEWKVTEWSSTVSRVDKVCNLLLTNNFLLTPVGDEGDSITIDIDYRIMKGWKDSLFRKHNGLLDIFFNTNISGGYDIEVPIKLTNQQYANTKAGTLFKLNDGLYKVKSIEGHDVLLEDDSTLTLTTLK